MASIYIIVVTSQPQIEAVGKFLDSCKAYGMSEKDLCVTLDIQEKNNPNMVRFNAHCHIADEPRMLLCVGRWGRDYASKIHAVTMTTTTF